jgi:hypothetical protein
LSPFSRAERGISGALAEKLLDVIINKGNGILETRSSCYRIQKD